MSKTRRYRLPFFRRKPKPTRCEQCGELKPLTNQQLGALSFIHMCLGKIISHHTAPEIPLRTPEESPEEFSHSGPTLRIVK